MMDRDRIAIETAETRRQRLLAAVTFGNITERRVAKNNVGRFIGSIIIAALIGAVCLGYSFVTFTLDNQNIKKTNADYIAALNQSSPLPAGATVDNRGRPIDRATGWVIGPFNTRFDPKTGWQVDLASGYLIDPQTNWLVDPATSQAVRKAPS